MPTKALPTEARSLKQCQHCMKSDTKAKPLQLCARCKRGHYCSRNCQEADWEMHKPFCKLNQRARATMKSLEAAGVKGDYGLSLKEGELMTKRWTQLHRPVLIWAVRNALELNMTPERLNTHLLYIILQAQFPPGFLPKKDRDVQCAFRVESAEVMPIQEFEQKMTAQDQEMLREVVKGLRQTLPANFNRIGPALVVVYIPAVGNHRIVPFGFDPNMLEEWCGDWKKIFSTLIEAGMVL